MKKSRIIIPALAVMALSMGAAVTSTVAWFTANRNAQSTSNTITIINPEGNLAVVGADGSGTTTNQDADTSKITANHEGKLRDASVNLETPASPTVWTSIYNAAGVVDAYREIQPSNSTVAASKGTGKGWIDSGAAATAVYGAYSYDLTFTYGDANTRPGTYGLFIDANASTLAGESNDLKAAMRVALVCNSTVKVFAPNVGTTLDTGSKYVKNKSTLDNYTDQMLALKSALTTYTNSSANMLETKTTSSAGAASFTTVTVYTWLEGSAFSNYTLDSEPQDFKITLEFKVLEQIQ